MKMSTQVYRIDHYEMPKDRIEARRKLNTAIVEIDGVWFKATTGSDDYISNKYDFRTIERQRRAVGS